MPQCHGCHFLDSRDHVIAAEQYVQIGERGQDRKAGSGIGAASGTFFIGDIGDCRVDQLFGNVA